MPVPRPRVSPVYLVLAGLAAAGLLLRLVNNDYGLPYVYSADEGSHFAARAVAMFGGDANPGYFQNPSAFTYLFYAALWVRNAGLWPLGPYGDVARQYAVDPTAVYLTGRVLAALLCTLGVLGVFWLGRRLFDARTGIAAAAIMAVSFLAVVYSRIAVTDVGVLLPIALSVLGAVRVYEDGRLRHYLLAGGAAGIAIGFKYTAGLVLLSLILAAVLRARGAAPAGADEEPGALGRVIGRRLGRQGRVAAGLVIGLTLAAAALLLTTPYLLLDFETARHQILSQAETASGFEKVGQGSEPGLFYYLRSVGWGLGLVPALLVIYGGVLEYRRDRLRTAVLAIYPLALLLFLSVQARYFGRWFLPAYPVLVLLAGVGCARLAELIRIGGWRPQTALAHTAVLAGVVLVAIAQPLAADLRSASVLGRTDTRLVARAFLTERLDLSARVVIEPGVPSRYYRRRAHDPPAERKPRRRKVFVRGFIKENRESRLDYSKTLTPGLIDLYRRTGFCTVMTMSLLRGRAERDESAQALAYYRRLERESQLLLALDPYLPDAEQPPFDFDLSYNYYPEAYLRPGPAVRIYRIENCRQQYGTVPEGTGVPAAATES